SGVVVGLSIHCLRLVLRDDVYLILGESGPGSCISLVRTGLSFGSMTVGSATGWRRTGGGLTLRRKAFAGQNLYGQWFDSLTHWRCSPGVRRNVRAWRNFNVDFSRGITPFWQTFHQVCHSMF